ncbi:MAG TPA: DUF3592 domain-containing protein [Acidimicrobiales bacterium]|nr:DUF3592 domain-containing protein [Acidimicrobiales bacterium]
MDTPPPGPALAVAATRAALRRSATLIGGLAALAGAIIALAVVLGLAQRRADDLATHGIHRPGTVTDVAVTYSGGRARQPRGTLTVRFVTATGARRTGTVTVGTDVIDYAEGDAVTVVYDPDDAGRIQVVGADDPDRNGAWLAPAGVGGLLLGLTGLAVARQRRTRRLLRSQAWEAVPARLRALPPSFGARGRSHSVLELYGPGDGPRVVVGTRGLRPFGPELEPTAWIVGGDAAFVVAPPGGRPVLLTRRIPEHEPEPEPDDPDGADRAD